MSKIEPVISAFAQSIWVREHIAHLQLWMSLQLPRQFPVIQKRKCVKDTGASPSLQMGVVGMAPPSCSSDARGARLGLVWAETGWAVVQCKVGGECPFLGLQMVTQAINCHYSQFNR